MLHVFFRKMLLLFGFSKLRFFFSATTILRMFPIFLLVVTISYCSIRYIFTVIGKHSPLITKIGFIFRINGRYLMTLCAGCIEILIFAHRVEV